MEIIHHINIGIHISMGIVGILVGLLPLFSEKGSKLHINSGRIYLGVLSVVVFTAFLGSILFEFRPFLFLLTLICFYSAFAGYRALKVKGRRPALIDHSVTIVTLVVVILYILLVDMNHAEMNKPVVYSTLATLLLYIIYDVGKLFYSKQWLAKAWIYDHIVRIISSYSALLSAFAGTVLADYKPYSQLVPSVLCILLMLVYGIRYKKRVKKN